jgi:cyclohexa-1,5-dienecarbonyl-CoA hydratase
MIGGPAVVEARREHDGAVCRLTLMRPPLNILDIAMLGHLSAALTEAGGDPRVRVLVLDADASCRAFCAGVDVADHAADRVDAMLDALHSVFTAIERLRAPIVAVVDGAALGGGCELVCGCDLVLASHRASFGQPEIKLGAFAPVASLLLPSIVGAKRAADWLLTGRTVTAGDAYDAGLVSRLVDTQSLADAEQDLLAQLLASSSAALGMAKEALRLSRGIAFADGLAAMDDLYRRGLMATADVHEGLAAFLARRPPVWQHR